MTMSSEEQRQKAEDARNRERLAQWWDRYCEARPMIWALGVRPAAVQHPFRGRFRRVA